MSPHPSGLRITKYHMLPSTSILIVLKNNMVIGTVSLIRKSSFGLPSESFYDLSQFSKFMVLGEVSSLAIHNSYRKQKGDILFSLFKFLYHYAIEYFAITHFVIVVNPKWFDLYQSILLFTKFEEEIRNYDFVNGHPGVGGWLNISELALKYYPVYNKKPLHKNLYHFFCVLPPSKMNFPDRLPGVLSDPFLTPELFEELFITKTNLISSLSDYELTLLREIYDSPDYLKIIPDPRTVSFLNHRKKRFEVNFYGQIYEHSQVLERIQITNISETGFGGKIKSKIPTQQIYEIKINLFYRTYYIYKQNFYGSMIINAVVFAFLNLMKNGLKSFMTLINLSKGIKLPQINLFLCLKKQAKSHLIFYYV